ncbi:MAG: FAD/NAD(P)-binding protein [Planctomycetales bacterium]
MSTDAVNPSAGNPSAVDPWLPHVARIERVRPEAPEIQTYDLILEEPEFAAGYAFRPGQFNMLYLPGFGEAAVSISSDAASPHLLSHTVRAVGNVTDALARKSAGDQIALRGPFGVGWPVEAARDRDVVVACGGVGLAPLRPAIYHFIRHREQYGRIGLLYGARTPDDLLYTSEYDAWRAAGIDVSVTVDRGNDAWQGPIGVVPLLFSRLRIDPARTHVFTCGPEIMMRFVVREALSRGVGSERVFISLERNMQCAVGFCGHCQLGPAFVCKDGPVFPFARMEPYLNLEDL